jgi:hypothetical protein
MPPFAKKIGMRTARKNGYVSAISPNIKEKSFHSSLKPKITRERVACREKSSLVYTPHKQRGTTRIDFGSDLV